MKQPVHYDIESAVTAARAQLAEVAKLSLAATKTADSAQFVQCQIDLQELPLTQMQAYMKSKNTGTREEIFSVALGVALGQILAEAQNNLSESNFKILETTINQIANEPMGAGPNKITVPTQTFTPTMGGNA